MPFFQRKGSKTYHSKTSCSRVPRNVKTNVGWSVRGTKPKAKMCIECVAKEKPKAKPKPKKKVVKKKVAKKKVTRKKSVAGKRTRRAKRK